jgi:hypothetical protein
MKNGITKNASISVILKDTTPLALYDVKFKRLVGVFLSNNILYRYLYPTSIYPATVNESKLCKSKMIKAWKNKTRLEHEEMIYAIRTPNEEQLQILGDNVYVIVNGYKEPNFNDMKGFNSTNLSLKKDHTRY